LEIKIIMADIKDKLREKFLHPSHRGEITNPDGTGIVGNARCGDILSFQIKVKDQMIDKVRFQCLGCGAAKAVAGYIAELAEGKTIEEIERMKMDDFFDALKVLPQSKWHCPFQALDALKMAIEDFRSKEREGKRRMIDVEQISDKERCPYCKEILGDELEYCESCEMKAVKCANCGRQICVEKEDK